MNVQKYIDESGKEKTRCKLQQAYNYTLLVTTTDV